MWNKRWRLDLTPADDRRPGDFGRAAGHDDPGRRMRYYTGIGHPYHLADSPVPVFISVTTLMRYKTRWEQQGDRWPVQSYGAPWAGDSGAFAALMLARDGDAHPWSMETSKYVSTWVDLVERISHDCPEQFGPDFVATQDWPCEPSVRARTGLTVREHQIRSLDGYAAAAGECEWLPWLPVLQGWHLEEYLEHFDMYRAAGFDLTGRRVGIGSVCRRGSQHDIAAVIRGLAPLGMRMHAFGLSINGLRMVGHLLDSSDSQAWSKTAREEHILLPGCDHRARATGELTDCRNCFRYALRYREEVLDAVRAAWAAPPVHEQLTPALTPTPFPWRAMTAPTATRSILRDHDFRLLWAGETVSQTGSAMTVVALPLVAIFVLHASPLVLGVLTAAAWLPALLVSLPAGAWVDQLGRRPVMQTANITSAALFASVPAAAWFGVLTLPHLVVVAFAGGVARVFLRTAFQAYLPTVVDRGRLTAANSWLSGSESAAELAGPSLAGLLAQAAGAVTAVAVDAASFAVAAVTISRIRAVEHVDRRRDNTGLGARIAAGFRYTFTDPFLRTMALFAPAGNFTQAAMQTLMVVFLVRVVGVPAAGVGILLAGMGAGGLAGAALAGPAARRFGTARALLSCGGVTIPAGLLLPLTASGWRIVLFPAGLAVVFTGVAAGSVISRSFRQAYVPAVMLARSSATMSMLGFGAIPLGALAGGWLATVAGVHTAMWATCVALLGPWLIVFLSPIRTVRDLPERTTT